MKTSLVLLFFTLVFSTNVLAKKAQITSSSILMYTDGPQFSEAVLAESCFYSINQIFQASVHTREGNRLSLQVMTDTETVLAAPGASWIIPTDGNWNIQQYGLNQPEGASYAFWVASSLSLCCLTKGRLCDAPIL